MVCCSGESMQPATEQRLLNFSFLAGRSYALKESKRGISARLEVYKLEFGPTRSHARRPASTFVYEHVKSGLKRHPYLCKQAARDVTLVAPLLARGGAVRLDLVLSGELLLVVRTRSSPPGPARRAATAASAGSARRARTRRPRGHAGKFVVGVLHALLEGLEELVAAALASEGAEARCHRLARLGPLAGTARVSRRSDAHCVVCSDAANNHLRT